MSFEISKDENWPYVLEPVCQVVYSVTRTVVLVGCCQNACRAWLSVWEGFEKGTHSPNCCLCACYHLSELIGCFSYSNHVYSQVNLLSPTGWRSCIWFVILWETRETDTWHASFIIGPSRQAIITWCDRQSTIVMGSLIIFRWTGSLGQLF